MSREVPVAFFDEFDSLLGTEPLGWLKYFLSPMQDGKFFDGDDTFHVGPAIFVFGGGPTRTFLDFEKKTVEMADQKAPDFISRLRGHLDVKDMSPIGDASVDEGLQVRRALLLRSLLKEHAPTIFDEVRDEADVDEGVIDAFLHVKKFKHGVRSMQAIIEMARLEEARTFQRSF